MVLDGNDDAVEAEGDGILQAYMENGNEYVACNMNLQLR